MNESGQVIKRLASLTPTSIGEALDCMDEALEHFHRENDYRAVFLHAYRIITQNVSDVIEFDKGGPKGIFSDPAWLSSLAGHFATLYFRSLVTFERPPHREQAWKVAHGMAIDRTSTVVQDLLLGINAHIGYDLAQALHRNMVEHGDAGSSTRLDIRKSDHDQANLVLSRSIAEIWRVIPRQYGGLLRVADTLSLRTDRYFARVALVRYRELAWWRARDLLIARDEREVEEVMMVMNRTSNGIAHTISGQRSSILRLCNQVGRWNRRRDYSLFLGDPRPQGQPAGEVNT